MRRTVVVLAVCGCWTGAPPPPLRVTPAHFEAPPAIATREAAPATHETFAMGDADRGCQLMVAKRCASCHFRGSDPKTYELRNKYGVDGMRRVMISDGHAPYTKSLTAEETEDLVTCMWERWF